MSIEVRQQAGTPGQDFKCARLLRCPARLKHLRQNLLKFCAVHTSSPQFTAPQQLCHRLPRLGGLFGSSCCILPRATSCAPCGAEICCCRWSIPPWRQSRCVCTLLRRAKQKSCDIPAAAQSTALPCNRNRSIEPARTGSCAPSSFFGRLFLALQRFVQRDYGRTLAIRRTNTQNMAKTVVSSLFSRFRGHRHLCLLTPPMDARPAPFPIRAPGSVSGELSTTTSWRGWLVLRGFCCLCWCWGCQAPGLGYA